MKSFFKKIVLALGVAQLSMAYADVYIDCQPTVNDQLSCPATIKNESKVQMTGDYFDASGYHQIKLDPGQQTTFNVTFDVTKFLAEYDSSYITSHVRLFADYHKGCLYTLSVRNQPNYPRSKFFGNYAYMTPFGGGGCSQGGGKGFVLSFL